METERVPGPSDGRSIGSQVLAPRQRGSPQETGRAGVEVELPGSPGLGRALCGEGGPLGTHALMVQHEGEHPGLGGDRGPHSGSRDGNWPWTHPSSPTPQGAGPGGALGATGLKMAGLGQGARSRSPPSSDQEGTRAPHPQGLQPRSQVRAEGLKSHRHQGPLGAPPVTSTPSWCGPREDCGIGRGVHWAGDRRGTAGGDKDGQNQNPGQVQRTETAGGARPPIWGLASRKLLPGVGGSSSRPAPPICAGLGPRATGNVFLAVSQAPKPRTPACGFGSRLPTPAEPPHSAARGAPPGPRPTSLGLSCGGGGGAAAGPLSPTLSPGEAAAHNCE